MKKEKEEKMNTKKENKEVKEKPNKIQKEKLNKKDNKKIKDSVKTVKTKQDIGTKDKRRRISKQKLSLIFILIISSILAIGLFINLVVRQDSIYNFDFTYSKMYRLTKESKEIIKNVNKAVEINIDSSLQYVQITEVLDKVTKLNDLITVTFREVEEDEDEDEQQLFYTTIFVSATDREEEDVAISFFDLNFDSSLIDGETFKQYTLFEEKLVNAIISVTKGEMREKPSIAFLTGLEGAEISEELGNLYTELRSFGVFPIELDLKKEDIPESVKIIGIVGPMKDINKTEYNKLIEFQARGGNFVIAATFVEENTHPIFKQFLSSYGVKLPVGGVLDYKDGYRYSIVQSIGTIRNYNNILLPIPTSDNELTKDMVFEATAPFFIFPTQIVLDSKEKLEEKNLTYINHILTSDMAVFKSQDIEENDIISDELPPDAIPNIYVLGTIVEKKLAENINSKAVIYSNYLFMTDLIIENLVNDEIILQKDNLRLAKNSFTYLHPLKDEMVDIKKGLVISPYKYDSSKVALHKVITYLLFVISMLLIIFSGVIMLYKRGALEKIGMAYRKKAKE